MTPDPSSWIRLQSDALSVAIDPQGAQLSEMRDATGRDLLWNGDPAVWKGRAPILFPIVGALNHGCYRWHDHHYPLSRHGFARDRQFAVLRQDERKALFRQTDDAETRAVYPFGFELEVAFRVAGPQLTIATSVRNTGVEPLPASLGLHPALRWPLPGGAARAAHYIEFEQEECAPIRRLDAQGLLTRTLHPTPVRGRRLELNDALFVTDALIFDQLMSRSLTYGADNGPRIKVSFPDATYLGLWTKPGAGFLCIEPWHGVADPVGFGGEIRDKPGIFVVPPGGSESLVMYLDCKAAGH